MAIKVKLLRPLDGRPIGSVVEYPDADAKRLEQSGVVEFHVEKAVPEKAAPAPQNKMAPAPLNKAAPGRSKKGA